MKKEFRLKKNHEIAKVVKIRQRICGECYNLYYQKNNIKTKIAFSVSKKYGTAVERNYAKRVAREIIREYYDTLPKDNIVFSYYLSRHSLCVVSFYCCSVFF